MKTSNKENKKFLNFLKSKNIRVKGEFIHYKDADQISDLFIDFKSETTPRGVTEADKKAILKDYKSWSGGHSPSEDGDGWKRYSEFVLEEKHNPEEVLEWFESLS